MPQLRLFSDQVYAMTSTPAAHAASAQSGTQLIVGSPATLIVRLPPDRSRTLTLTHEALSIGRHPTNQLIIDVPTVSAEHALIEYQAGRYRVIDRGSRNGTFVNGQRITEIELNDGDLIRLGEMGDNAVTLTYRGGQAPQATAIDQFDLATYDVLLIGRAPDCDLTLDSPLVSRHHARLERSGAAHNLVDLGSTNGTFVNSRRIDRVELHPGDVVQLGPYRFTYQPGAISQVISAQRGRLDALHLTRRVEGGQLILNDVSLSIAPREFVAIVGGSGSGKTTLLNALSGFQPAEGRLLFNGDDYYANFDLYRNLIGYVPQDDIIHHDLPVGQALRYAALLRLPGDTSEAEIDARIERVLAEVDMDAQSEQIVGRLSGGQRKRVSISMELLAEPGVFFLDEATSGLDPGLEKKLMFTLRRLADGGRTVVLVTHATANIKQCDHVAFIGAGRLVFFGPPDEALRFFEVQDFADIYEAIEEDPTAWEKRFRESTYYAHYVLPRISKAEASQRGAAHTPRVTRSADLAPRANARRQFSILTQRYFELVVRDKTLLTLLLAVMPAIGLLLAIIARPSVLVGESTQRIQQILAESGNYSVAGEAQVIIMMLVLAASLVGMFAAAFELVRERAIYRRERMVNLRLRTYLSSKLAVLIGFAALQVMALLVVVALRVQIPFNGILLPGPLELYLTLLLVTIVGILLGLFISAVAANSNSVIYLVLFAVFVQIIFAGVFFELPGLTKTISYFTPARWAVEALGSTIDLPTLNDLGQIEVRRTVDAVDPTTGQKVQREVVYGDKLPLTFTVGYEHQASYLLSRWAVLIVFAVLLLIATAWAQGRVTKRQQIING
jgi:ABC-type multidrug transport system ATPase subunit/pSer/pThr/pTyr-binding forkhead associated (FHA) protein/ABC-type multidrug transport system permease subunit